MDLIQLAQWSGILLVALFVLIRGADLFIEGAKQIGAALGMSSFAIGVLIVGIGTSLPELASSIAAVLAGSSEIAIANAVGSNITNILLIVGVLAALGGPVMINKNLLKTELPIFFIATVHFVASVYDGVIDRVESALLFATFCAYIWYLFSSDNEAKKEMAVKNGRGKITLRSVVFTICGVAAVLVGAKYTVDMAVNIATGLSIPIGLVSIGAIAIGTSLPELFVSLQALKTKETDLAIGNIFGSNAFNILMVVGIPGLIMPLEAGEVVMELGIWIFVAASLILFINGLARQVQKWEGVAMLIFFVFFLVKLVAFV
ncbi:calcium/sodium antiporter [Candidatus Kaiserbacteria bacterium]|nr:calcium/sodium antiporter [Candidatus Kaiserbacteria bacterium]USN88786.1 MAG: calcium/sodium antiporter [Candidatus Nomurabacteria bacterium]